MPAAATAPNNDTGTHRDNAVEPAGAMPVQLSDVKYRGSGPSVRSATLWPIADLEARVGSRYVVRYQAAPAPEPSAPTDPTVRLADGQVEMTTSRFGIRLRPGAETFARIGVGSELVACLEQPALIACTEQNGWDKYRADHDRM